MKKIILASVFSVLSFSTLTFAQGSSAESRANRIDEDNLRSLREARPSPVQDRDIDLEVLSGKDAKGTGVYLIKDGDVLLCTVLKSSLTSVLTDFSCNDNYVLKGKIHLGIFGAIYAYFEIYESGYSEALASAEIKIGKASYPYVEGKYDGGK